MSSPLADSQRSNNSSLSGSGTIDSTNVKNCSICQAKFSILLWRHHCRHCAATCCATCLPNLVILNTDAQYRGGGGGLFGRSASSSSPAGTSGKVCDECLAAHYTYVVVYNLFWTGWHVAVKHSKDEALRLYDAIPAYASRVAAKVGNSQVLCSWYARESWQIKVLDQLRYQISVITVRSRLRRREPPVQVAPVAAAASAAPSRVAQSTPATTQTSTIQNNNNNSKKQPAQQAKSGTSSHVQKQQPPPPPPAAAAAAPPPECPVCLMPYNGSEQKPCLCTSCGNSLCHQCIAKVHSCPLCRATHVGRNRQGGFVTNVALLQIISDAQ